MGTATLNPPGESGLLERERELAALDALLAEAAAGEARIALIEGPAGIGKSQLLAAARRNAPGAGLRVLHARAGELEREFPFGVVRQLLEPVLVDPDDRERLLAGAAAPARAVFDPAATDSADGGDVSFAALHGLYWLTVNLAADEPLLLAIDDLHWADRPSLRFLVYLARRLEGLPVLVAATLRPAEPDAAAELLGELANDPLVAPVRPGHLSEAAVAALVRARFGDGAEDAFATACHAATGGNPLLLNELLKALETEGATATRADVAMVSDIGPRAASRAVLLRLARLPGSTAEVARAIAILGENADLTAVAKLTGLAEADAAAATGALARAEIIRRESPLGFVHPLVRAAVYQDIPPGERELRHEAAAAMLTESGAPPEQIAAHLLAVPARGDAGRFELLRTAARESLAKGAAESAVAYLTRALDEAPSPGGRGKLLLELGQAETRVNGPAATENLRQALELLEEPLDRALAAASLARTVLFTGSPEETKQLARQAAAALPEDALDLRQRLEALELFAEMFGNDWQRSGRFERYRERPPGDGAGPSMLMGLAAWHAALKGEPAAECVKLALAALEDGRIVEDEGSLMAFPPTIVLTLADHDGALAAWDAIRQRLKNRGSLFSAGGTHVWRGHTLWLRGEVDEALAELTAAREALDLWGDPGEGATYSGSLRANVLIERGDLDDARAVLERAGSRAAYPEGSSERVVLWQIGWARLHLRSEPEESLRVLDDLSERLSGRENPTFIPWRILRAQTLARLERHDEAREAADSALEVARRWGAAGAVGAALRVRGAVAGDGAIEPLEEAIEVLHDSPARLEHAKAYTALGAALRRAGRPRDAREPLRLGLELAEVCGAPPVAEYARAELHAAGLRPRASALSGPGALTPSERRVADLAASGQTNRDIAQALFVTPKTVEVHLSNAYRKLGIGSRRELEKALAEG